MKTITFILLIFLNANAFSQEFVIDKKLAIDEPTEVSIDRVGNIYYATFHGDIIRINGDLDQQLIFSPINPNTTTILEAWQGLRVFAFHKDLQQYRLINRNLSLHEDYSFPPDAVNFAEVATPSFDNNIWVFDQVDFSLKKYDITGKRLWSRTTLDQLLDPNNYEILFCKEYQNRLFISTRDLGILIFDNFGNYIKTYDYKGITFFNFWEDALYFLDNDELVMLNLYDEVETRKSTPKDSDWLFVLIYEDKTYFFSKNEVLSYK